MNLQERACDALVKRFQLDQSGTDLKTEVIAGITTFMTMAYILVVNPITLADAGMNKGALFTATALASIVATFTMSLYANLPFALAPGMGLNAFFAYTVVLNLGYSWQFALTAVFIEGLIFLLLTFFNVREALVDAIPINIKHAVSVGIGLFISFIGLVNAEIVVKSDATLVTVGSIKNPNVIIAVIGLIISSILLVKNVKSALLIGILVATVVGIPLGITPMPESLFSLPPSLKPIAFKFVSLKEVFSWDMLTVVFTFLFVDMFDTIGLLIGTGAQAGMLDENGKLPRIKQALFSDAFGTTVGACLGTSTITTFAESAAGVAAGGRTGLTSFITGLFFVLSLFLAPIFTAVPAAATAPALILVGLFMMGAIFKIDLDDLTEGIPAFFTIIMMPLTYSIAEGLVTGILSYAIIKLLTGRAKDASPIVFILALLFLIKILL